MNLIPNYISKSKKLQPLIDLINEAIFILSCFGIPVNQTERRLERMGMAFLAVVNVKESADWIKVDGLNSCRSRDIIKYWNKNFNESIADSSYDDIRREDLKLIVLAEIIISSSANQNAARNDGTRRYAINPEYIPLIKAFRTKLWESDVKAFIRDKVTLQSRLSEKRDISTVPITISSNLTLQFSFGKHNELLKSVIEQFLPRYGYEAEVLYVGDAADKFLHLDKERLNSLNFFELAHGELPDVVAYSTQKKWLYLIEAVHTSGEISPTRLLILKELTKKCQAEIIFVTAFLDRKTFRKFVAEIAWETEVWIAESPDHLIHFDGEKFLGAYP
jgi:hypothetical protein